MNAKPIPGPWAVERPYGEPGVYVTAADPRKTNPLICRLYEESEGCANLIAAAPELLEALRNLLAYANKYSDTMAAKLGRGAEELGELADSSSVAGMARAAIAKAMGGDHA